MKEHFGRLPRLDIQLVEDHSRSNNDLNKLLKVICDNSQKLLDLRPDVITCSFLGDKVSALLDLLKLILNICFYEPFSELIH